MTYRQESKKDEEQASIYLSAPNRWSIVKSSKRMMHKRYISKDEV